MEATRFFLLLLVCFLGLVEIADSHVIPDDIYKTYYLTKNPYRASAKKAGRGPALTTSDCDSVTGVPDWVRSEMDLDSFYEKYTHAYGIPIISSSKPPDDTLRRACYVVRFLLADRKDLRDAMHNLHGRVGVIAYTEKTNEIPEHSYLPDRYNKRARGIGGMRDLPISTTAEENILCYKKNKDPWYEEDILVHEFSHGIHLISINEVDKTWERRLTKAYKNAKKNGLWANTYAISNIIEYFAEGVQSFFDVEVHRTWVDNIHNDISTREALLDYDPRLYELIREIFPCENRIVDRCDDQDEISVKPMRMDCPYVEA